MSLIILTKEQWFEQIKNCHIRNFYQDPRWLTLIETVYPRLKIHYLGCFDLSGNVKWLLPLVEVKPLGKVRPMLISLPYANYGGFLFPNKDHHDRHDDESIALDDNDLSALQTAFQSFNASIIEIREMVPPLFEANVYDAYQRFEIHLPDTPEVLWEQVISGNARTSVRKADNASVETVINPKDGVTIFSTLNEKNAAFHGTPLHSKKWYKTMYHLFEQEICIIAAKHQDQFVGAGFMLIYGNRAILHALTPDPKFRQLYVSDKLVWACLKYLVENKKAKIFDFGRTRPDKGQIFFKQKWGGKACPIYYTYLLKPGAKIPQFQPTSPVFFMATKIWQRLPLPLTRIIGPFLRVRISS